jgi:5-oxoprolinase (ATP-hydrolysing)
MMDIHTIAAGGGSVVRFADGRLQVGPESAGADPGPACYRRGGPATVTDCNVVLGRIRPERFPAVFGASGTEPLDVEAARLRVAAIAAELDRHDGTRRGIEHLADEFLQVAVARMANAIRDLALRQGQDPARFTLLPFGGAAGQHACAVADALGIASILLDPLAGVLSAHGIGLALRRCVRRRTAGAPCSDAGLVQPGEILASLVDAARAELRRQGVPADVIDVRRTAHLRFEGSDTSIEVEWDSPRAMCTDFAAAHQRLYGFANAAAPIVIAEVSAEAFERSASTTEAGAGLETPVRAAADAGPCPD